MSALAQRIKQEIAIAGICNVDQTDLAPLWTGNPALSDIEKRALVEKFAREHGFATIIDYGVACAVFRPAHLA